MLFSGRAGPGGSRRVDIAQYGHERYELAPFTWAPSRLGFVRGIFPLNEYD